MAFTLRMPRRIALLTLLCLLVFAAHEAPAHERAAGGKELKPASNELKKAEAVLSRLRRLEAAAAAEVSGDFEKVARKL